MKKIATRITRVLIGALFILVLQVPIVSQVAFAATALTIDGAQRYQTMDGFGTSVNSTSWKNGELRPALDKLTDGGTTLWRVIIDNTDWETVNDDADPNNFNWTYYNTVYSSAKFQDFWNTVAYLNQKGFTSSIALDFMGPGPSWMGGDTLTNTDTNKNEWVEMISSLVYYARNTAHVQFGMLEPANEPDWQCTVYHEGMCISSAIYADIMTRLAAKLDTLSISDLRLVGPDTAGIGNGVSTYMPQMMSQPSLMAKVDHFAFHDYSGSTGGADAAIKSSSYPAKNFWMSEVSQFNDAFPMVGQNAAAILTWDGYDSIYSHAILHGGGSVAPNDAGDAPALLAYNSSTGVYTPRKEYYQFEQLFKYVPAGAVRVAASQSASGVTTFAFTDPVSGRVTVIGNNTSSSAITFTGTLANITTAVPAFEYYTTTSSSNFQRGSDVPVSGGTFSVVAPSNGIFTLTYAGVPDTTAPTAPVLSAANANQANLNWAGATDNMGVSGYDVYRSTTANFTPVSVAKVAAAIAGTTFSDGTLAAGTYYYQVQARDAAGNVSPSSNEIAITIVQSNPTPALTLKSATTTHQTSAGSNITSSSFTAASGDLLVAFLESDGPSNTTESFNTPATSGLTWTLRKRANASSSGTAEIWTAVAPSGFSSGTLSATRSSGSYMGSVTIAVFSGADTTTTPATGGGSGTNTAPSVSLTTTRAGSWVWGAGDDWASTVSRAAGADQTIVDQYLPTNIGSYWVQRQNNPTANIGSVTINDTTPSTSDKWNLVAIEILPLEQPADSQNPTAAVTTPTAGANLSGTVTVSATASDDIGVTGVGFYDGDTLIGTDTTSPYSVSWNTSTAANGTHDLTAKATDASGKTGTSTTVTVNVFNDAVAPTTPTHLTAAAVSETQVNLAWDASTDDVGVTGYEVWRATGNGSSVKIATATTAVGYIDNGVSAGTIYHYTVKASDGAGNTSAPSTIADVTTPDNTAPVFPNGSSLTAQILSSTEVQLNWAAGATDNIGVTGYRVTRMITGDIGSTVTLANTNSATFGLTDNGLTPGTSYSYTVRATDGAGNLSASLEAAITLPVPDSQAPGAPANLHVSSSTTTSLTISWDKPIDNIGVTGYQVWRSDSTVSPLATITGGDTLVFTNSGLTPGTSYSYTVKAIDAAGNVSDASTILNATTLADLQAPTTPGNLVTSNVTLTGITLSWNASSDDSGIAGYQVWRSDSPSGTFALVSGATPNTTFADSSLQSGTAYYYFVRAIDIYGNSADSVVVQVTTLTPDTTPPAVSLTAPATGTTISGTVTLAANASDNVGVVGVQFLVDGVAIGSEDTTSPYSYSLNTASLTNGTHTLAARARDAAGNATTSSTVTVTVNNVTSTLAVDTQISTNQSSASTSITSGAFSTTKTNDLLVAFITSDGSGTTAQSFKSVTTTGLTWTLRQRVNSRSGTAEIWTAVASSILTNATVKATRNSGSYVGSITVVAFKDASTVIGAVAGANAASGAPSVSLTTTRAGSLVFGVGNDWDSAAARTVGSSQTMVNQYLASVGDTFWVQRLTNPVVSAGTVATLNDTTPTADRWNFAAIEILPAQ
jgi:chitodextrinase